MFDEQGKNKIIPTNAVPMDVDASIQPNKAVFFELGIEAKAGHGNPDIALNYRAVHQWTGITSHADFEARMTRLIKNENGNIGARSPRRNRDPLTTPGRSKDTRLSIEWPVDDLSYIVIKLDYDRNWQFSHDSQSWPFMMHENDAGTGRFLNSMRFSASGDPVNDGIERDGCKFASFVSNGVNFAKNPQNQFQHRFNILIDVLELDNAGAIDNRIPIIIDPDVRNPGGNSP